MIPASKALEDVRWMKAALRLGHKGRPSPNPHVGAVVVKKGVLIARGYHRRAGEAHAEAMALCDAGRRARGATLYVTLEPCNHWGRTPPCTEAVLRAGVSRVVIGCKDPDPHVPGAIRKLRRAGVDVVVGVCQQEAEDLVADFRKVRLTGKPFVTLKAAVTLDGRIALRNGASSYITGIEARRAAHRMRDRSDAVLVGIGTVLADDPQLTVRNVRGKTPVRVVMDGRLRLPLGSRLLRTADAGPLWIVHGPDAPETRRLALAKRGCELLEVPRGKATGRLSLASMLRELARREVVRLLVEGGGKIHGDFLAKKAVDRMAVFVAPTVFGDPDAVPMVAGPPLHRLDRATTLRRTKTKRVGTDMLIEGWV